LIHADIDQTGSASPTAIAGVHLLHRPSPIASLNVRAGRQRLKLHIVK